MKNKTQSLECTEFRSIGNQTFRLNYIKYKLVKENEKARIRHRIRVPTVIIQSIFHAHNLFFHSCGFARSTGQLPPITILPVP